MAEENFPARDVNVQYVTTTTDEAFAAGLASFYDYCANVGFAVQGRVTNNGDGTWTIEEGLADQRHGTEQSQQSNQPAREQDSDGQEGQGNRN